MKKLNVELSIYTFDIDFAGHVGNSVYVQWVEIGRCKFMEAVDFPVQSAIANGFSPVMVHMSISYKHPLYLGDQVRLEMWLSDLKRVTHTVEFRFYNGSETLVASGYQRGIFVDQTNNKPRPITSTIRDLFLPYLQTDKNFTQTDKSLAGFSS
jgi:acyl-CoA thioester hydrolase